MESNCYKIVIIGKTSFSIQGIGLREKIERIVNGAEKDNMPLNVKGRVRNLHNGNVEIVCVGSDVQKLLDFLNKIREDSQDRLIADIKKYDIFEPDITTLTDFSTERSDDQSEMIWALRGAGNRFAESTSQLEELTKQLMVIQTNLIERDKKVAIGRLLALHFELVKNRDLLANPVSLKDKIHLDAILTVVQNPAVPEKEFIYPLLELLFQLDELDMGISYDANALAAVKDKIDSLLEIVKENLSKRGERL